MLGLYVSDHPLMGLEGPLRRRTELTISEFVDSTDAEVRKVGGVVTGLQRKWTRKGDLMAVFILEDLQTSIEVMVFPKTMTTYGHLLVDDAVVGVKARLDRRDDTPKLMAMDIELLELVNDAAPPVRIQVPPAQLTEAMIERLKRLLKEHPGESQVFLHLGADKVLRLPDEFCVDVGTGLLGELRVMLGPAALLS
jgi:DNA polymerase-3 subunit alpha